MKKWFIYLALFALVWIFPIIPNERISLGELEPVELLYFAKSGQFIRVESDTGSKGTGDSIAEALEDIKQQAKGNILLETADCIVIDKSCVNELESIMLMFRPASAVCVSIGQPDLSDLTIYLRSHKPKISLGEAFEGEEIPILYIEEEMRLEEKNVE